MTPPLSDDLRRALAERDGGPVRLADPTTGRAYVLLAAEQYENLRALLESEEFDPRETYPFVDAVMSEDDKNDPALESYQKINP